MTFGEKLQKLRRESALSQEKLAEQLHVSRQAISKWELGTAAPDTDNIVRLSKFFQVPLEYLMLEDCTDPSQAMGWRTQPQAPPEVPQAPEKRPSWWTKGKPIWFVLAGFLLEFLTFLFSYDVQAKAMEPLLAENGDHLDHTRYDVTPSIPCVDLLFCLHHLPDLVRHSVDDR